MFHLQRQRKIWNQNGDENTRTMTKYLETLSFFPWQLFYIAKPLLSNSSSRNADSIAWAWDNNFMSRTPGPFPINEVNEDMSTNNENDIQNTVSY